MKDNKIYIILARKTILRLLSLALFIFILLLFYPISYGLIRLTTLILATFIYSSFLYLVWHNYKISLSAISLSIATIVFLLLPGKTVNINTLQTNYISQLDKYENVNYLWGGENKIGIDCSGLVRQGLIKANLQIGLLTLNPNLVRMSFDLWWHDTSAEALRDGYRGYTERLFESDSINKIDYTKINSGDMAVTQDGVHILAYLGNSIWIEADPIYKKVIKVRVPEAKNIWFNTPVYVLRWQQFINK